MKTPESRFPFRKHKIFFWGLMICLVAFPLSKATAAPNRVPPGSVEMKTDGSTVPSPSFSSVVLIDPIPVEWPPYPFEPKRGESLSADAIRTTADFAVETADRFDQLSRCVLKNEAVVRYFDAFARFTARLDELFRHFTENEDALRQLALRPLYAGWPENEAIPHETVAAAYDAVNALHEFRERVGTIRMRRPFERALIGHLRAGAVSAGQASAWMEAITMPPEARARILRKGSRTDLAAPTADEVRESLRFETALADAFESNDADDSQVRRALRPLLDADFPSRKLLEALLGDPRLSTMPAEPPFSRDRFPKALLTENTECFQDVATLLPLLHSIANTDGERRSLLTIAQSFERNRRRRLAAWNAVKDDAEAWWGSPNPAAPSQLNWRDRKSMLDAYGEALEESSIARLVRNLAKQLEQSGRIQQVPDIRTATPVQ